MVFGLHRATLRGLVGEAIRLLGSDAIGLLGCLRTRPPTWCLILQSCELSLKFGPLLVAGALVRHLELNERFFLLVEGKLFERFDNGTQCDLSWHFRILMTLGSCLMAAYYVALDRWPICKLSQNSCGASCQRLG